jgi:hypothetical protein
MKTAPTNYIQEEQRVYGAVPRVKAVIKPFDSDFSSGFGPGLGTFTNCSCPSAGVLQLDSGYTVTASWISDVLQAREGQYSHIIPSCSNLLNCYLSSIFLRSAATYAEVNSKSWVEITWGATAALDLYWQVKIEFAISGRSWTANDGGGLNEYTNYATDGGNDSYLSYAFDSSANTPGKLENLKFSGQVQIDEEDIIDCGHLIASRPAYFHDIHGETHVLTLDNRGRQWIPGPQNFLKQDGLWFGKEIHIYTGFELATGETDWILQYVGRIRDIRDISSSFTGKHQAKLFSSLLIKEILDQLIGSPAADGSRQPYMDGYYKARAEIYQTTDPYVSDITKAGSSSANLVVTGTPTNTEDVSYFVMAETTGEIGTATIKWSMDGGNSWEKSGIVSMSSLTPLSIKNGLHFYFEYGAGNDLVAGDYFWFTSVARRTVYALSGAPFQEISNVWFNGIEIFEATKNPYWGLITVIGNSGLVDARVVKSDTTNPVDIIKNILISVGLESYLDELSFTNARMDLADYQIGIRFEGVAAWKAIQSICAACLIWFWIDANKIYISAYTGESV